jgi:hypothetical protein
MPGARRIIFIVWHRERLRDESLAIGLSDQAKLVLCVVTVIEEHVQVERDTIAAVAVNDHGGASATGAASFFENVVHDLAFAGGAERSLWLSGWHWTLEKSAARRDRTYISGLQNERTAIVRARLAAKPGKGQFTRLLLC